MTFTDRRTWALRTDRSDIYKAKLRGFPLSFPAILGRDVSAIVRAVSANAKHFKPGKRVLGLSNANSAELVAVNVLITGALGSVGRAAVHTAKKIGAQVIAGVRGKELGDARSLGVSDVLAIDDDGAIAKSRLVDAIADAVGREVAAKLIAR